MLQKCKCALHTYIYMCLEHIDTKSDQEFEQMINKSTERRDSHFWTLSPGTNRLQDILVLLVGCKPSALKCRLKFQQKSRHVWHPQSLEKNCFQNPNEFHFWHSFFWQILLNKISQQIIPFSHMIGCFRRNKPLDSNLLAVPLSVLLHLMGLSQFLTTSSQSSTISMTKNMGHLNTT